MRITESVEFLLAVGRALARWLRRSVWRIGATPNGMYNYLYMTKPIDWRGSAFDDLRAFPDDAKRNAGYKTAQGDKDIAKRRYGAVLIERMKK